MSRLISHASAESIVAWRAGHSVSAAQYLADVARAARSLPERGPVLNLCTDRYRFAVGLGAALTRRHTCLLPPTHTSEILARLHSDFPDLYILSDQPRRETRLPQIALPDGPPAPIDQPFNVPEIEPDFIAALVFTSGSTGQPTAHAKTWGKLQINARAEGERLTVGFDADFCLVGTVPAQHMYGFESTLLLALLNGGSFDASHAFYPADICAALAKVPEPRVLVTTPFHLRTLLDAEVPCPPLALIVSATAPLSPQLALRAEETLGAPLVEIYGCTEAGQLASRRTTAGATWQTLPGVRLDETADGRFIASGGHVEGEVALSDELILHSATEFTLLGRSADMVNIAGKRTSLAHLNHQLNSIPGVQDGVFYLPTPAQDEGLAIEVQRPIAFAVAPDLSASQILTALRRLIDPAFLPRPVHLVDALPRNSTGKLPTHAVASLAQSLGQARNEHRP
ncbi:MAG: AMP-binding protein [Burkholderiales bacterium]